MADVSAEEIRNNMGSFYVERACQIAEAFPQPGIMQTFQTVETKLLRLLDKLEYIESEIEMFNYQVNFEGAALVKPLVLGPQQEAQD